MKRKRSILFSDYKAPAVNGSRKDVCIQSVRQNAGHIVRGETLFEQVKAQLGYVGPWFFIGSAGVLLVMLLIIQQIQHQPHASTQAFGPTLALLSMMGPAAACLCAPVLARSHANGMWELEEAAFYNLPRLTAVRLFICTIAMVPPVIILAGIGGHIIGVFYALAALVAPFLLASGINYFILGRLRGMAGSLGCIGINILLAVLLPTLFTFLGNSGPQLQAHAPVIIPCFILCASALLFVWGAKRLLHQSTVLQ